MDDIEKWVKESIDEEHEIEALVQKEVEWVQNARVADGPGLTSKSREFVKRAGREFPEFIWEWNKDAYDKNVVVNLLASEESGLPKEDYLSACARVVAELDVSTHNISELRVEEFVAFAASYGISVTFRKVAELPREAIRRINERLFGGGQVI